ncbi:MAG: hypothetical protein IID41_15240, partial [Planctomycetes bacterium]|nr:hypothetical protein [Planctomycetota bacterium]
MPGIDLSDTKSIEVGLSLRLGERLRTQMDIQQARHLILTLRKESGVYAMLDAGWRYVAGVPHDPEIAELVLEALLEVGLGGVARELLQLRQDLDPQSVEIWRRRIGEAPSGRISWAQLKTTYHSNLSLLVERQPHLADIEPELDRALRGLHLYQTSAGHYLLSKREAGQYREWMPGISDYAYESELELPAWRHGTPLFIDRIGLGPLLERVYDASAEVGINQSLPIFVLDHKPAHLAAWLHLADHSRLLGDERVFVFCGPQSLAKLEQFLDEQIELAAAPGCVITQPGFTTLTEELEAMQLRVQASREEAFGDIMARLKLRYAERDLDYWRRRLQDKGPILAMTSRATTMLQYSTRDIGHAFEEMGYEFHLLIESADHCQLTGLRTAQMMLE